MQNEPEVEEQDEKLLLDTEKVADLDVPDEAGEGVKGGQPPTTEEPFT